MDNQNQPKLVNAGVNINVNLDTTPIFYTDSISVTTNEDGIVFDFMQKLGPTNQVRIVSRVGMSREHAKKFYKVFGDGIKLVEGQVQTVQKVKN